VALTSLTKEISFLKRLIDEIGLKITKPTTVHCDNKAAIEITKSDYITGRVKHMDIKFRYVKALADAKRIIVAFVRSADNLADLLTKAVSKKSIGILNE